MLPFVAHISTIFDVLTIKKIFKNSRVNHFCFFYVAFDPILNVICSYKKIKNIIDIPSLLEFRVFALGFLQHIAWGCQFEKCHEFILI